MTDEIYRFDLSLRCLNDPPWVISCLADGSATMLPHLSDEFQEWLGEELGYLAFEEGESDRVGFGFRADFDDGFFPRFFVSIEFADFNDAMLFKLRWG